jgi:hypothetical protein
VEDNLTNLVQAVLRMVGKLITVSEAAKCAICQQRKSLRFLFCSSNQTLTGEVNVRCHGAMKSLDVSSQVLSKLCKRIGLLRAKRPPSFLPLRVGSLFQWRSALLGRSHLSPASLLSCTSLNALLPLRKETVPMANSKGKV